MRSAGHVLPDRSMVSTLVRATAWIASGVRMVSEAEAETGFTLFHPVAEPQTGKRAGFRTVMARVRPNIDITEAVEAICLKHGFANAILRGSIGSLIGARYADGASSVDDIATEVLVT